MSLKSAYEQKLEAQLDERCAEVRKLEAKAREANADMQIQIDKETQDIKKQIDVAQQKLNTLKASGEDALDDLKGGLDRSWAELSTAVKEAAHRFQD